MSDQADQLAEAIRLLLREQLRSPGVRAVARELARLVLDEADRIESQAVDTTPSAGVSSGEALVTGEAESDESGTQSEPVAPQEPAIAPEPPEVGLVPLAIGDALAHVAVPGSRADLEAAHRAAVEPPLPPTNGQFEREEIDLALLAQRSRLKAASCRLYVRRRATANDPDAEQEVLSSMNQMIEHAKSLRSCFLWVFWRYEEQPEDERLEIIATNYEALAESAELCDAILRSPAGVRLVHVEQAFQMLAEANSALRQALRWTWLTNPDTDQDEAHNWLRQQTRDRQIFVPRYMKVSDPADPRRAADLLGEIRSLMALLSERRAATSRIETLLKKLRYHARRLRDQGAGDAHDCQRVNDCVEDLIELGVAPDDPLLREALRHLSSETFPQAAPASESVLGIIADNPDSTESKVEGSLEPRWSARVAEARGLLEGSSIVVVGGERRPDAVDRLKEAFSLQNVEWMSLTEHGSAEPLRAPIMRRGTRLVVVLTKLTGHLHADEARAYAREAGVPIVTMPAGYNPEQVAEQVLIQAGERLRAMTSNGH
ncbi:MAG: hypothetical protein KJZ65_09475 [Phycisphaerales bacterium]|nr:hypothetical protein [Phycisphaerales bacterium]